MPFTFKPEISKATVNLELRRSRLFGSISIPFEKWSEVGNSLSLPIARLRRLVEEGRASPSQDGVQLSILHTEVVQFTAGFAEAIGLPPVATASCQLDAHGRVDQKDTVINFKWRDSDFSQITPTRVGAFLHYGDRSWRLTPPVFALLEAIDGFNESAGRDPMERIEAWGPVQTALQGVTGEVVEADAYLKSLTIFQAGAFALDVTHGSEGPSFTPILMAREKRQQDIDETDAPEDGDLERDGDELRDETADALLPPDLQDSFSRNRFVSDRDVSPAYVLGRGQYVVLDPALRRALQVVQVKSRAPSEERREFIKNPRLYLATLLDDEPAAGSLFIETTQYSERVTGLKLWDPKELPWLARFKTAWLPEGVPIIIGGEEVKISEPPESLAERILEAKAAGKELMELEGREIRLSVLEAALEAFMPPDPDINVDDEQERGAGARARDRDVLDIEDNIEESSFVVDVSPRHPQIAAEIGAGYRVRSLPKPHQEVGFQWLVGAWAAGLPGVLLADDMGLGKTYQALAFLAWCRKAEDAKSGKGMPMLIVAPTALLKTWIFEAEQHLAPDVLGDRVDAFGGGLRDLKTPKGRGWTPETALDISRLRGAGWILTTYETLATYHRVFARVGYRVAVFDEMQRIKSPTTLNTHAAKAMSVDFVLGLTGTPVENRLEDIWCIMDRIAPGLLGDLKSFSGRFSDATHEQLVDLKDRLEGEHGAPAIMMRRLKEDILDGLPSKEIKTYQAPMPDRQANAYAQIVRAAQSLGGNRTVILEAIHRLRGIALHPKLDAEIEFGDTAAFEAWANDSARVSLTLGILDDIYARGEKALLFLEYKAAQRIMAAGLVARYQMAREPMIINGDVPGAKRQPMVSEFQSRPIGFDLMILSPRAAGVGLTITAANHVIHLSRWWNPAVEDQCNDRVYRIGQDKPVTIHVPMAVHPSYKEKSFDLTLNGLLERKRSLSHGLLAPPESADDVDQLFAAIAGSAME
jgi:hypothetical protein